MIQQFPFRNRASDPVADSRQYPRSNPVDPAPASKQHDNCLRPLLFAACLIAAAPILAAATTAGTLHFAPPQPLTHTAASANTVDTQALSLARGDFDGDGIADLAVGLIKHGQGVIEIYRGKATAIYPFAHTPSDPADGARFFPATAFATPVVPEFIATGDFDNDGHLDVVTAATTQSRLALFVGDGHGWLQPARTIALPGTPTAMARGDFGRRDGLADLAIAVRSSDGTALLVFRAAQGALQAAPARIALPAPAGAIAFWRNGARIDIAANLGRQIALVAGDMSNAGKDNTDALTLVNLPFTATALTAATFSLSHSPIQDLVVADTHGALHVLRRAAPGDGWQSLDAGWLVASTNARIAQADGTTNSTTAAIALDARLASGNDLVVAGANGFRVFTPTRTEAHPSLPAAPRGLGTTTATATPLVSSAPTTPSADTPPTFDTAAQDTTASLRAALPMRLSPAAHDDLVAIPEGASAPVVYVVLDNPVVTVNSTTDVADGDTSSVSALLATPGDDGVIGLREAITAANNTLGADVVQFDIPASDAGCTAGVCTIQPTGAGLPFVSDALTLDATTQPGYAGQPLIQLDGSLVDTNVNAFDITAGPTAVRGFVFNRFATNCDVTVFGAAAGVTIESNVFGLDASGTAALGGTCAVYLYGVNDNTVGGTLDLARNVIAGYTGPAVTIASGGTGNTVEGNFIGLDRTGTLALPDAGNDMLITDSSNNTLGGTAPGTGNVIGGDSDATSPSVAIAFQTSDAQSNLVQGNLIGTDVSGMLARGTASIAVYILDATGNTIGGSAAAAGNVIAAAGVSGVRLVGATQTVLQGNAIGTAIDHIAPLANTVHGVQIDNGGSNNVVGGRGPGAGNVIAFNGQDGVYLRGDAGSGNSVVGNTIHHNGLLGIDLCADYDSVNNVCNDATSVLPDDPGDADSGANGLQNYPILAKARPNAGTEVSGTLNSTASAAFTLDFYASPACDPSGYGQGTAYLGSLEVDTDVSGDGAFTTLLPAAPETGAFITATATSGTGDTSEFSACVESALFADGFE